jgi:hypothetical protein
VDRAYGGLTDEERAVLEAARVIMQTQRVPFEELSEYCQQMAELEKIKRRMLGRLVAEPDHYAQFVLNAETYERWLDEVLPKRPRHDRNGRR